MKFDDLNEGNFVIYAMKEYMNPQCLDVQEFYDDLKKIKYLKRLFNQYKNDNTLKERLIFNHLIIFYNVFSAEAATRILFYKIEKEYWPILKTFLLYLNYMPEKIKSIRGETIYNSSIKLDEGIIGVLRAIDRIS